MLFLPEDFEVTNSIPDYEKTLSKYFRNNAEPQVQPGFRWVRKVAERKFPEFFEFRPEFCSEFCSEFSPDFLRSFCASFRGKQRPEKTHQKSPPFFNAKFQGKYEKFIHKTFLEGRQSKAYQL